MNSTNAVRPSPDERFEIVRSRHRRAVLRYLGREQSTVGFAALVEYVAACEADCGVPSDDDRRTARISLVHVTLPKLEEADLVRYDSDADEVSLTDAGRRWLAHARCESGVHASDVPTGNQ
jgi:hypothetical protein